MVKVTVNWTKMESSCSQDNMNPRVTDNWITHLPHRQTIPETGHFIDIPYILE